MTIIALLVCFTADGQTNPTNVVGLPADAAMYPIPGLGVVNLKTGNLHIEIPIRTVTERNGQKRTIEILYDSAGWLVGSEPGPNGGPVTYVSNVSGEPGWLGTIEPVDVAPIGYGRVNSQVTQVVCESYGTPGTVETQQKTNWTFTDSHGTVHPFPPGLTVNGCQPNGQAMASDGSGYWLEISSMNTIGVYDMHGNNVLTGEDANGNILPAGDYPDELGRPYSVWFSSGIVSKLEPVSVWTDFGVTNYECGPGSGLATASVTLPDGRLYSFQYDDAGPPNAQGQYQSSQQGHYGSLTGITLPTGGQISIVYQVVSQPSPNVWVKSITTPDGTWSFSYQPATYDSLGNIITPVLNVVTAPADPNSGLTAQTTFTSTWSGAVITDTVASYAGMASGTPLRSVSRTNPYGQPQSIITSLNGLSSHVDYTYQDGCTPRVKTKKEYDFSGALIRETDLTYLSSASDDAALCLQYSYSGSFSSGGPQWTSAYLQGGHNIIGLPSSVTIYGSGGAPSAARVCASCPPPAPPAPPPGSQPSAPDAQTNYSYDTTTLSTTSGWGGTSVLGLTTLHDDTNYGSAMTIRGNLTAVSQMVSSGKFVTTSTNYFNILGEIVKTLDGNQNATLFDFTDQWADSCITSSTFAYPTAVKDAAGNITNYTYYSCDGSLASWQTQNDINAVRPGTVTQYDTSQRPISVAYPDGGSITYSYGGSTVPEILTVSQALTAGTSVTSSQTLDGLGRTVTSALTSDPSGTVYTSTSYDALGRMSSVSNPYRTTSDLTYGTTTYTYDALGRTLLVCNPDNGSGTVCKTGSSYKQWTYSKNTITLLDETGNSSQNTVDALGRLTSVTEANGAVTNYTYDSLNDLGSVSQLGISGDTRRARSFTYDALGRLTSATNPEDGTMYYGTLTKGVITGGYDGTGNLISRTDGRGVTTTFAYDALNRLLQKASPVLPVASTPKYSYSCYQYDSTSNSAASATGNFVGRLTNSWTQISTTPPSATLTCPSSPPATGALTGNSVLAYDPMGRVTSSQQCVWTNCTSGKPFSRTQSYDLLGNVKFWDNGMNGVVSPLIGFGAVYDGAGRLRSVAGSMVDATHPATLFSVQQYAPTGGLQNWTLGNNLNLFRTYDSRLRVTSGSATIP